MLNLNPTHNLSFFQLQVNRGENENYCSATDPQQTNQDHLHVFFSVIPSYPKSLFVILLLNMSFFTTSQYNGDRSNEKEHVN